MTSSFRTPSRKAALLAIAGIGILGTTLAGCSTSTPASSSGDSSSSSGSTSTGTTASVDYKDGSYTQQGTYSSPGGPELISVALTLKSNVVTAVTVKTVKADPTATQYEGMFEAGIGGVVIGKNINALNVTRVAGSSLTSMGFDDALAKIKAAAKG